MIIENQEDQHWWHHSSSGTFSVMSFINAFPATQAIYEYDKVSSKVWCGLVPTKAKLLVWLLIHGRLNTKERLHRQNILRNDEISCPL